MNRREISRQQGHQRGWVRVPGRPRVPCAVHDISPKGAMLVMVVPPWLPIRFELALDPDPNYLSCEVRHVASDGVGVVFCKKSAPAAAEPGPRATRKPKQAP